MSESTLVANPEERFSCDEALTNVSERTTMIDNRHKELAFAIVVV